MRAHDVRKKITKKEKRRAKHVSLIPGEKGISGEISSWVVVFVYDTSINVNRRRMKFEALIVYDNSVDVNRLQQKTEDTRERILVTTTSKFCLGL